VLELTIKPEWAGKEIVVMPYLDSPRETVSVKTNVEKWRLPKIVVETTRKEGVGEDGNIAPDMHFGLMVGGTHIHTDDFNLERCIVGKELRRAIKKEALTLSDVTLFLRFEHLIRRTSISSLQSANLKSVAKMKMRKSDPDLVESTRRLKSIHADVVKMRIRRYDVSNEPIANAVFEHKETKTFLNTVNEKVEMAIKNSKGNIDSIKIINDIKGPVYNNWCDQFCGLKIAIHDTWGHRVTITDYNVYCNVYCVGYDTGYSGKLTVTIFDHFGLDYNDINVFGTKELLSQSVPNLPTQYFTRRREDELERLAEGFRAWFILQHYRGYRPCVNIMEKEGISIGGILMEGQLW
jgi:hypothetical protein